MTTLAARFLDALYPPNLTCWACSLDADVNESGLCAGCAAMIRPAIPRPAPPGLDGLAAGVFYDPALRGAMHRFKYSRQSYLAAHFAAFLPELGAFGCDAMVPVPLWPRRERKRGYNQSALLAVAGARLQSEAPPLRPDILRRIRDTGSQTLLSAAERRKNVRGAFRAAEEAKGLRILLIDDVVTTGSTLSACAEALRAAGARAVYACAACAATGTDDAHKPDPGEE